MSRNSPVEEYFGSGLAAAVGDMGDVPGRVRMITEACLQYMAAEEPSVRAMVHIDPDGSLKRADELDAMLAAGQAPLPLHGVPVVIKEIYSVSGMPDSNGSRLPTPDLFEPEGSLVRALRAAGCIVVGKSFSIEFACGQFNLDKVMPVNPVRLPAEYATGGSSSGSAAALAAGYSPLTLGTDTGGSVRVPAALCGVVGFKPGEGSLPTDGIFPLSRQLDTPGFFVGSVADAARVFAAVGGEITSKPLDASELRIGIPVGELVDGVEPVVADAFASAIQRFKKSGVTFVEVDLPSLESASEYFATALPVELLQRLGKDYVALNQKMLDPIMQDRLLPFLGNHSDLSVAIDLNEAREFTLQSLAQAGVDCWLMPTTPCVAPKLADLDCLAAVVEWQAYVARNTRYTSALGNAAISLPLPTDGLPVGLQIAAPADQNARLLQVAATLELVLRS